jgi:hypothetical protein
LSVRSAARARSTADWARLVFSLSINAKAYLIDVTSGPEKNVRPPPARTSYQ